MACYGMGIPSSQWGPRSNLRAVAGGYPRFPPNTTGPPSGSSSRGSSFREQVGQGQVPTRQHGTAVEVVSDGLHAYRGERLVHLHEALQRVDNPDQPNARLEVFGDL